MGNISSSESRQVGLFSLIVGVLLYISWQTRKTVQTMEDHKSLIEASVSLRELDEDVMPRIEELEDRC